MEKRRLQDKITEWLWMHSGHVVMGFVLGLLVAAMTGCSTQPATCPPPALDVCHGGYEAYRVDVDENCVGIVHCRLKEGATVL